MTYKDDCTEIRLRFDNQPGAIVAHIETIGEIDERYLNCGEQGSIWLAFEASEAMRTIDDVNCFDGESLKALFLEFIEQISEAVRTSD